MMAGVTRVERHEDGRGVGGDVVVDGRRRRADDGGANWGGEALPGSQRTASAHDSAFVALCAVA